MASASSGDTFHVPIFGVEAQRLIACNQRLQELGIHDTIKLPRIVVCGDQSTGKSSLIEAISNIKVPRAAGLCTKCPIAINLSSGGSSDAPWTCTGYVENKYYYEGDPSKRMRVTTRNPMGPWKLYPAAKAPTKVAIIHDRAQLADLIDSAQKLVLDPRRSDSHELKDSTPEADLETFSPNPIRLDISVENCPNLSFVDLPGVIQTAGKGEPKYLVELVENLARQYARDENNIILLTLPINHDVSNSKSYSIMQREDAQSRTMAVFTKVDIARKEERDQCIQKYFSDDADKEFEYGNHLVMLAETDPTFDIGEDARPEEQHFLEQHFFSQEPWTSLSNECQTRLGTQNLMTFLRKILFRKTAESLPSNVQSISVRLEDVEHQLKTMGPAPDFIELPYQLREQLYHFEGHVRQLFISNESSSPSRTKLNQIMDKFRDRIFKDRPTLVMQTNEEMRQLAEARPQTDEGPSTNQSLFVESEPETMLTSQTKDNPSPEKQVARYQRFTLDEIRRLNGKYYKTSLSGDIEPQAIEVMNRMSVQFWNKTLLEFMNQVSRLINGEVKLCIDTVFGHQKHLQLYDNLMDTVKTYLDNEINKHWTLLDRHYDAERLKPYASNQASLRKVELDTLEVRRNKRKERRLELAQALQLARHPNAKRVPKVDDLGVDEWDLEVQMSAKTRAYYDIASFRFVDNICQETLAFLVPACHQRLADHVRHNLGLDNIPENRDRITIMMSEDPERETLRARLIDERHRLIEGRQYIQEVINSTTDHIIPVEGLGIDLQMAQSPGKRKLMDSAPEASPSKRSKPSSNPQGADERPTPGAPLRRRNGMPIRLQSFGPDGEMSE